MGQRLLDTLSHDHGTTGHASRFIDCMCTRKRGHQAPNASHVYLSASYSYLSLSGNNGHYQVAVDLDRAVFCGTEGVFEYAGL